MDLDASCQLAPGAQFLGGSGREGGNYWPTIDLLKKFKEAWNFRKSLEVGGLVFQLRVPKFQTPWEITRPHRVTIQVFGEGVMSKIGKKY